MDEERAPLAGVAGELPDAIADAWERAGLDSPPAWPTDERRYRLRPPASDPAAGVDTLAAVLDASERTPERLFVHLAVGRRADFGRRRRTLETLSGHPGVLVADDDTAGTLPLTGATFDALVTLYDDLRYALVSDADDVAIVEFRDGTLTAALADADALEPTADIEPLD